MSELFTNWVNYLRGQYPAITPDDWAVIGGRLLDSLADSLDEFNDDARTSCGDCHDVYDTTRPQNWANYGVTCERCAARAAGIR